MAGRLVGAGRSSGRARGPAANREPRRTPPGRLSGARRSTLEDSYRRTEGGTETAMSKKTNSESLVTEITPRSQDFGTWYIDVVRRAELADYSPVKGLHGHPAVRLRDLGADPARPRRALQGDRARERVLPAVHSREPPEEGGGARRGLRAAGRLGHPRRRRGARRAARVRPTSEAIIGTMYAKWIQSWRDLPDPHQPVGERRALGEGHASVPAHDRVPLAGRAHRARDRRRGARPRR